MTLEPSSFLADLRAAIFGGGPVAAADAPPAEPGAGDDRAFASLSAFDNFTRSLGSQTSRRMALKVSVFGLVSTALDGLGLRPANAAADCLCGRQLYDPALQCCTPSGVQTKHPVASLAACPNRVAHPGYSCVPNGCGPAGGQSYPNGFGAASFLNCCNNHDCCYGNCNSVQATCDSTFGGCMHASCNATYSGNAFLRALCNTQASAYESAVSNFGGDAYTAAQQAGCDCCGSQPCPTCPGGTCRSLPSCQDPGCVCFQTVEGRGFCHLPQSCAGLSGCSASAGCPSGWACVSVTCCGSNAICIRPCFVVGSGSALEAAPPSGPTTARLQ